MATVIIGMTVSLDGFVEDRAGSVARLYPDLADLRDTAYMQDLIDETGTALMGKRAFEMGTRTRMSGTTSSRCPSSWSPTTRRPSRPSRTST